MTTLRMEDLVVGHEDLDAEHEVLVRRFTEVQRAVAAGDRAALAAALKRTWDDVVAHFVMEEALMDGLGYPERKAHRTAHQLFLEDLRALVREVEAHALGEDVATWAAQRLPEWLSFHIETNDAPLARFAARAAARDMVQRALGEPPPPARTRSDA
jgi:hemerythrin